MRGVRLLFNKRSFPRWGQNSTKTCTERQ